MLKFTGTITISEADYTNKDINLRIFHPNKLNDISIAVELVKQYQTIRNEVSYTYEDVTTIEDVISIVDEVEVITPTEVITTVTTEVITPIITNHIDVITTLTNYTYSNSLPSDFDSIEAFVLNKLIIDFPNITFEIL